MSKIVLFLFSMSLVSCALPSPTKSVKSNITYGPNTTVIVITSIPDVEYYKVTQEAWNAQAAKVAYEGTQAAINAEIAEVTETAYIKQTKDAIEFTMTSDSVTSTSSWINTATVVEYANIRATAFQRSTDFVLTQTPAAATVSAIIIAANEENNKYLLEQKTAPVSNFIKNIIFPLVAISLFAIIVIATWMRIMQLVEYRMMPEQEEVMPDLSLNNMPIRIEVKVGNTLRLGKLKFERETLIEFAKQILDKTPFAEAYFIGVASGHLFTRTEFIDLRDWFLKYGFADWRNVNAPAQGLYLKKEGIELIEYLAHLDNNTPLPQSISIPNDVLVE